MHVRPGRLLPILAVLALAASLSPVPAGAQQQNGGCEEGTPHCGPYSEDPGNGCLGPDDPFCNGGGGGGSGTSYCYLCQATIENGQVTSVDCVNSSSGKETCTITYHAGDITCETSGASCSSIVVTP